MNIDIHIDEGSTYRFGDIVFKGFDPDTGTVRVQLAGACVGCSSSQVTLKNGVENLYGKLTTKYDAPNMIAMREGFVATVEAKINNSVTTGISEPSQPSPAS